MALTNEQIGEIVLAGGFVTPYITSFAKQAHWSTGVKQAIAGGVSAALAVAGTLYFNHGHFGSVTLELVTGIFTASQLIYHGMFTGKVNSFLTALPASRTPAPEPLVTAEDVAEQKAHIGA